mgnify:CR=1 FL=1
MIALALACQLAVAPVSSEASSVALDPEAGTAPIAAPQGFLTERKVLPSAMSLIVPGSGQFVQGQFEKGALHLGAAAALGLLMIHADAQQSNVSTAVGSGANVRMMSAVGLLGLALWSPLDAWLFGANDRNVE